VILAETLLGYSLQGVFQTDVLLRSVHKKQTFFQVVLHLLERATGLNPSWVAVLQSLLQYNPRARPSAEAMLHALMLDPAFARHRQEMLSDLLSPAGEASTVRYDSLLPACAWPSPAKCQQHDHHCPVLQAPHTQIPAQTEALTFDGMLLRQRLYNDRGTDFELDMATKQKQGPAELPGPLPWWAEPTTPGLQEATTTPAQTEDAPGDVDESEAEAEDAVESGQQAETAQKCDARVQNVRGSKGCKMWTACLRFVSKVACCFRPAVCE
jgi:hypothetical protein